MRKGHCRTQGNQAGTIESVLFQVPRTRQVQACPVPVDLPLDAIDAQAQQRLFAEWRQNFLRAEKARQIGQLQKQLSKYELGPAYVNGVLVNQIPESEYGRFGDVTQAFALQFLYQYAPQSRLVALIEHNVNPATSDVLAELYLTLIANLPIPVN